jgi:threonine/homoserine/homoserine lactone efflux protein
MRDARASPPSREAAERGARHARHTGPMSADVGSLELLGAGAAFGLAAGLSPGPLLALVVSQTVRHGPREGLKVAVAPLITDAPIILATVFLLTRISSDALLGAIALAGGAFVAWLGVESIRTTRLETGGDGAPPRSWRQGAVVNALSPHPYLFWITVGAPILVSASSAGLAGPLAFLAGFYLCLVGSKVAIALAVGASRGALTGRAYPWIMRILGAILLVFAVLLVREGLILLGVIAG